MRCGNDPRARLTPGDAAVLNDFRAYLAERPEAPQAGHAWVVDWEHAWEARRHCLMCGVTATRSRDRQNRWWTEYVVAGGWSWHAPDGSSGPPPCPPPPVEALCPHDWSAIRYDGPKGDEQLDTALRTWCERHQVAVADCPEPRPPCPGAGAHDDGTPGRPGPCTGEEGTCGCMCPACVGDTPDVYGFEGDY